MKGIVIEYIQSNTRPHAGAVSVDVTQLVLCVV